MYVLGNVNIVCRPIRISLLADINSPDQLLRAMRISSSLWGGMFFTIDVDGTVDQVSQRIEHLFDPDVVASIDSYPNRSRELGYLACTYDDLIWKRGQRTVVSNGIHIFNVLAKEIEKRSQDRKLNIFLLEEGIESDLFGTALFGSFDPATKEQLSHYFSDVIEISHINSDKKSWFKFLKNEVLTVRKMTRHQISANFILPVPSIDLFFLMDDKATIDIVDYWNLRATGLAVYPVIRTWLEANDYREYFAELLSNVKELSTKYDRQVDFAYVEGRGIGSQLTNEFCRLVEDYKLSSSTKLTYHKCDNPLIPSTDSPKAHFCSISHQEKKRTLQMNGNDLTFEVLAPKFEIEESKRTCYANEISFNLYGHETIYAETLPRGPRTLSHSLNWFYPNWRFGYSGPIFLADEDSDFVTIKVPDALGIACGWFKMQGIQAELSSSGRIATQMHKQIGQWGVEHLAYKGMLDFVLENPNGNSISTQTMRKNANKIGKNHQYNISGDAIISHLLWQNMLELGVQIQCDHCLQKTWTALNDLKYTLRCQHCLGDIHISGYNPSEELKWCYRLKGTLALPSKSHGAYIVLLTHRFFAETLRYSLSPALGINLKHDNWKAEVDLFLLAKDKTEQRSDETPVFVECKTNSRFEMRDIQRMKRLYDSFPNSLIGFSMWRSKLTDKEKETIYKTFEENPDRIFILGIDELIAEKYSALHKLFPFVAYYPKSQGHEDFSPLSWLCHSSFKKYLTIEKNSIQKDLELFN